MMQYDFLEDILQCPVTKTPLKLLDKNELNELNNAISTGSMIYADGTTVNKCVKSAFISSDGNFIYPIEEDIVILLPDLSILKNNQGLNEQSFLSPLKKNVQGFYNEIGWEKTDSNFIDAARFEDLRTVSDEYRSKCHLRINDFINKKGKYMLDIASGPIQYQEYLTYSNDYEYRICADISFAALKEAKKKLGSKGLYFLCDITQLPLKNNVIDGIVSLHTIYHVPAK